MTMGPTVPSQAAPPVDALDEARRHRAELLETIHSLEAALAVPAAERGWRARVARALARLQAAFAEHVDVTEGPHGLYGDLLDVAPRLANQVRVLVREHGAISAALDALAARTGAEPERVRGWASDLLRELSRHRQRGADLVYEAYATDIGGEN